MLRSLQEFADDLTGILRTGEYRVGTLSVRLLEGTGGEIGMEVKITTLSAVFRQRLAFREIGPALTGAATGWLLLAFGLGTEKDLAVLISLMVALAFTLGEAVASYLINRGMISWTPDWRVR